MNILSLDAVALLRVCMQCMHTCIALANTHPRLRKLIRTLASELMQHFVPNQYRAQDPFLRLLHAERYTYYSTQVRYVITRDQNQIFTQADDHATRHNTLTFEPRQIPNSTIWRLHWTAKGMHPPRNTHVYLVYKLDDTPTSMHLTLDDAVNAYLDEMFDENLEWMKKLYANTIDYQPHLHAFDEFVRRCAAPAYPYTRENVAAHLRTNMHTWPLTKTYKYRHVWIVKVCI
jgi:hypothetical protein